MSYNGPRHRSGHKSALDVQIAGADGRQGHPDDSVCLVLNFGDRPLLQGKNALLPVDHRPHVLSHPTSSSHKDSFSSRARLSGASPVEPMARLPAFS